MGIGSNREQGILFFGGGSGGQADETAIHGGVQAKDLAGSGQLQPSWGDRSADQTGGVVFFEPDPVAQAAGEGRVGGIVSQTRTFTQGEESVDRQGAGERENARLKRRAERAEGLVELQKKVSEILGIELNRNGEKD